jgi:hypothetical protein
MNLVQFNKMKPNEKLEKGCESGNIQMIEDAIKRGANNFHRGLYKACLGGHMKIINKMIKLIYLGGGF